MKKENENALSFLCGRNPFDHIERIQWVSILFDFADIHGEDALAALAGFYLYAIKEIGGEEGHRAIVSTFSHDVLGRKDAFMDPRSSDYAEFFLNDSQFCQVAA